MSRHDAPKFDLMMTDRMTPDAAIKLRDSLHIAVTHYPHPIIERARWKFCDDERADSLVGSMQRFLPDTDPLIWSETAWRLAQSGKEAYDQTRAGDNIWRLGGAQMWFWDGFEVKWRDDNGGAGQEFFQLDTPCFCDQWLLVPTAGAADGSPGLTIIFVFFPTTEAVKDGADPWPYLRALPRLKPGDGLGSTYAIIAAALGFMQLNFVIRERQRPSWQMEKQYQRAKLITPSVQVITLRRVVREGRSSTEAHPREWSCQWPVRGHWRKQWYPSFAEHRVRWIMPYIKGNPDAPLKAPAERVLAVVR